jgi:outer membrane protein OmpA-like peptidoglycan-associated protein
MLTARPSTWAFESSRSLNISAGSWATISKEGGTIWLNKQETLDKKENAIPYSFDYDAIGVGVGLGTLPVSFGPKSAKNGGELFMLNAFVGEELTADDITGLCRIQEVSAGGAGGGGTLTAVFLGMDLEKLAKALGIRGAILSGPVGELLARALSDDDLDWTDFISTGAKGLLVIAGVGVAVGKGIGVSDALGYLKQPWDELYIPKLAANEPPTGPEDPSIRSAFMGGPTEGPPITLDGALFNTGLDTLKPAAEARLREVKNQIAPYSARFLVINGFTDNVGQGSYDNQGLSERRAKTVKKWLIANANRKDSDVVTRGYGEKDPVASNKNEGGRAKNRRVEIGIMQAAWRPR